MPQSESITAMLIGRVGDLIVATPALRAVRRKYPAAHIRLVVHSQCSGVVPLIPFVDSCIALQRFPGLSGNIALLKALREPQDLFIDLNPSYSKTANALTRLAVAKEKVGFIKGRGKSPFTKTAAAAGEKEHMLDRYARLAIALGTDYEAKTELRITPEHEKQADKILGGPVAASRRRVLIHPGNFKKFDNRWPEEKFVEWTDALQADPRLEFFYLAGPGEAEPVGKIVAGLKRPAYIIPPSSIGTAGAVMRRMDAVFLSITGTTHLAAALGVPTFGLYAGYTDAVWRPRGSRHGGVVSDSWDSCRDIPVAAALTGFKDFLGL